MGKIYKCNCGQQYFVSDYDDENTGYCHKCEAKHKENIRIIKESIESKFRTEDADV